MDRETAINKMQEYVQDFKAQLEKKDPDSLAILISNTKKFFEELMTSVPESGKFSRDVREFGVCLDRMDKACEDKNMDAAERALADMEDVVERISQEEQPV